MITLNGIRNAILCSLAFVIVAAAAAPMPSGRPVEAEPQGQPPPPAQRLSPEDIQASQTARGIVLTLDDVLLDPQRFELESNTQRSVGQLAAFLDQHPERRVQVEGFTDSQGTPNYNLELSQRRADAVAMALIHSGIDARRVRAIGFGEQFPVASNNDESSRQLNRRVEIIVANDDRAIPGRHVMGAP